MYPPQVVFHPQHQHLGQVRVVPLSKRRGVSVEPVLLRRNGSGSSGRSSESKPAALKLTTPTLSFGDKMAGLRDAGTSKLFGPIKKRSQTSEKGSEVETPKEPSIVDDDKTSLNVENPVQRKNSSDALRTAVQQSKAAIKKGLKIGSTGLTGLRRGQHGQNSASDVGSVTPEKVIIGNNLFKSLNFFSKFKNHCNNNFVLSSHNITQRLFVALTYKKK
jgi:hypothetical protein